MLPKNKKMLYGCETWSLILREEHRLRAFENRLLRRMFRPKSDEMMGPWRKLHNEDLHDLYSSPNIVRNDEVKENEVGMACSRHGHKRNTYTTFVGESEGKRPLRRLRHKLEDNIKIDHRETEWDGMDWAYLNNCRDQWRPLVNRVMNIWTP
jgi:hypothetical protein